MMKLSKMTDYAVIVLAEMAKEQGSLMSASQLAEKSKLPEPTVSKILKLLTRRDLVNSVRGANGGYSLDHAPETITIAAIIEATEGPIVLADCVTDKGCCDRTAECSMQGQWNPVNNAMQKAMESVSLKQMMNER